MVTAKAFVVVATALVAACTHACLEGVTIPTDLVDLANGFTASVTNYRLSNDIRAIGDINGDGFDDFAAATIQGGFFFFPLSLFF